MILLLLPHTFIWGAIESQRKLMFHFDKIEVRGALQVFVEPGKRNREVEYFASSEIIGSVRAEVRARTLFLEANNTFDLSRKIPLIRLSAQRVFPVEILVSIDQLNEIRLHDQSDVSVKGIESERLVLFSSSSGNLLVESLRCPTIELRHEGNGKVVLKGRETQRLKASVYNHGEVLGEELFLDHAEVNHFGFGEIYLAPEKWLNLKLQGPGNFVLLTNTEGRVVNQSPDAGRLIERYE